MKDRRPNFVCIVADQLRHDLLGCAGHPLVRTPNLDRLAARGLRFERCYTIQPMCMATRATWLTGRTPRSHGVRCNGIPLRRDIPTLPGTLAQAGYRTHAIGKIHLNPWMPQQDFDLDRIAPEDWPEAIALWDRGRISQLPSPYYGFDSTDALCGWWSGNYGQWLQQRCPDFQELIKPPAGIRVNAQGILDSPEQSYPSRLPPELHYTHWATECSEKFFRSLCGRSQPFFLWHSIPDPHPPFSVAEPYYSMYRDCKLPEPLRRSGELEQLPPHYRRLFQQDLKTAGRIAKTAVAPELERAAMQTVLGIISQWDAMVGRIVGQLEAHGLSDNTVIVVMSDHGQMLGDHWMHNMPPTHLDGVLRVPAIWRGPQYVRENAVTSALASHLDFAPTILDLAGVPIPEGACPPRPEAAQQRPAWPGKSLLPVLTGEADTVQDSVIAENDEDYLGLRQRTLITADWHLTCYIGEEYGELFDLRNDPGQLFNLWDNAEYRDTKRDLQIRLLERFAETDSVLPRRMGHA
ncbi:MAG: sulfatase-like hydrolase/transferase [Oligosphaeraceae bacterium]|nr:sulfatase-like hydrolase/transferase [Oligosphaeraceae bacterium]